MNRLGIFAIMKAHCIVEPRKSGAELSPDARKLLDDIENLLKVEQEIGCPLEVRCKLCDRTTIYNQDGKSMAIEQIGEHYFYAVPIERPHIPRLMYIKGYKKTWWLKADRSE